MILQVSNLVFEKLFNLGLPISEMVEFLDSTAILTLA